MINNTNSAKGLRRTAFRQIFSCIFKPKKNPKIQYLICYDVFISSTITAFGRGHKKSADSTRQPGSKEGKSCFTAIDVVCLCVGCT